MICISSLKLFNELYSIGVSHNIIISQDQKLNDMSQQVLELQSKHTTASTTIEELQSQIQQLKDQNALLKAQKGKYNTNDI